MPLTSIGNISRKTVTGVSLCIFFLLLLINHLWGFFGHYGYDDMTYAGLANTVLTRNYTLGNDHANYRWIIIFLTALSYKVFGINDHSSALMPVLFTFATAWLLCRSINDKWQAAIAIFLFGLHPWTLFYADKIMPDVYVAFFFFAAIYIIYRQKKDNTWPYISGVLLAGVLFLGVLAKETIILTIPVFVYLALTDVFQKRNFAFWIISVFGLVCIMGLYLLFLKIQTGHFLQRYYAIKAQSYFNPCSYDLLPFSETYKRITSGLLFVFIRSGLFWLFIFAAVSVVGRKLRGLIWITSVDDFFPVVFMLTLLCCNFMSTSIYHYVPMCEAPRHYLFLVPLAAIAAANGLICFFRYPQKYFWVTILFFIIFYLSRKHGFENLYFTYLPLAIITTIALVAALIKFENKRRLILNSILGMGIASVILAQPEQSFIYARQMGYRFQKRLFMKNIKGKSEDIVVVTNPVERNYGPYYMSYDTSHVIFRSFEDIKTGGIPKGKKIYLLLDGFTSTVSSQTWGDMPKYAQNTQHYKLIDRIGGAELFEINKEDLKPD